MSKRNKLIYWIATAWLSLGMLSTGIVQFLKMKEEADMFTHLGYPSYLLTMLAVWKFAGVIVLLLPKFPLLKEWAYAGFFFSMSGALLSHIALGDPLKDLFPPMLLLLLTITSWYFRPADRKLGFKTVHH
nr:DoxX family protein [uncultured Lacibacter sp.]